jgi:hypothetical protein
VTVEGLLDEDGSAIMVHADRDNFAHIPERYVPDGPDQTTLDTGDAGDRIACGAVGCTTMTMPAGGAEAGGGEVGEPAPVALYALGGTALLGAAALALGARARRPQRQP